MYLSMLNFVDVSPSDMGGWVRGWMGVFILRTAVRTYDYLVLPGDFYFDSVSLYDYIS